MRRGNMCAYSMHLVGRKMRELVNTINTTGNLKVLDNINMPTNICGMKYLEDMTNEVRDVTVIQIGLPVQAEVCFYL